MLLLYCIDTPRYRGMPSELDCWMEWIDNQMADEVYEPQTSDDFEEFTGGKDKLYLTGFIRKMLIFQQQYSDQHFFLE